MTTILPQDEAISMSFGPPPGLTLVLAGMAVIFLGAGVWVALRRSRTTDGGTMERPERIAQLYGYSVCLIAVIVTLMSVNTIVEKVFALQNPLVATNVGFGWGETGGVLTSFEAYKATYGRSTFPPNAPRPDTTAKPPTEAELRARYEALRADQFQRTTLDAHRELTKNIILLILAIGLFWWHWRWVRTR